MKNMKYIYSIDKLVPEETKTESDQASRHLGGVHRELLATKADVDILSLQLNRNDFALENSLESEAMVQDASTETKQMEKSASDVLTTKSLVGDLPVVESNLDVKSSKWISTTTASEITEQVAYCATPINNDDVCRKLMAQMIDYLKVLASSNDSPRLSAAFAENLRSLVDGLESLIESAWSQTTMDEQSFIADCRLLLHDTTDSLLELSHLEDLGASPELLSDHRTNMVADVSTSCESDEMDAYELEQELQEMQATHQFDVDRLRSDYGQQLTDLRTELSAENSRCRKLQDDIETMQKMQDQSLDLMQRYHKELVSGLKENYEAELGKLRQQHIRELTDEKQATKIALDAIRRTYEVQLQQHSWDGEIFLSPSFENEAHPITVSQPDIKQLAMLEQMREELGQMSAAYSAKCVENSQIEEDLASVRHRLRDENKRSSLLTGDTIEKGHENRILLDLREEIADLKEEVRFLQEKLAAQSRLRHQDPGTISFKGNRCNLSRSAIQSRRTDERYHSSPHVAQLSKPSDDKRSGQLRPVDTSVRHNLSSASDITAQARDHPLSEGKSNSMSSTPVSERRKFFESLVNLNKR